MRRQKKRTAVKSTNYDEINQRRLEYIANSNNKRKAGGISTRYDSTRRSAFQKNIIILLKQLRKESTINEVDITFIYNGVFMNYLVKCDGKKKTL